jgi:carboxypeptidase C (cathepsin A)
LEWGGKQAFLTAPRFQWWVNDSVAGYVQSSMHLTFLSVIGSGHFVPHDQPEWALDIIEKFVLGHSFASTNLSDIEVSIKIIISNSGKILRNHVILTRTPL